jgi:hypothetical protein
MWGALSDEKTGLSFTIAAGPRQRSHFRVRVPWDSWPYFTLWDSRLSFLLPLTTRRATVEVFDAASTRDWLTASQLVSFCPYKAAGVGINSLKSSVSSIHGNSSSPIRCYETCLFKHSQLSNISSTVDRVGMFLHVLPRQRCYSLLFGVTCQYMLPRKHDYRAVV